MSNQYDPPEHDKAPRAEAPLSDGFSADLLRQYDFSALERVYRSSCNILGLAGILGIVMFLQIYLIYMIKQSSNVNIYHWRFLLLYGVIVLEAVTIFGLLQRDTWGRTIGLVTCALIGLLSLINMSKNFGSSGVILLIAVIGAWALAANPQLFGANRVRHGIIAAIYKERKNEKD